MKTMFSKRRFLAALSATLLILAALVTSCVNPLDGAPEQQGNNGGTSIKAPAGKGLIRISVADPDARSITPSLPTTASMFYLVEFKRDSTVVGNTATDTDFPATGRAAFSALNSVPIILNAGTYNITITAWSAATAGNALAGWTGSKTLSVGDSETITANLKGWTDEGTGTFTYSIGVPALPTKTATAWTITTPPGSYSVAKMEIFDASNQLQGTAIDLTGSSPVSGNRSLPVGCYDVVITLTADKCQNRIVTNALHIYNTMTSNYSYSIPSLNQNIFSVEFDLNGEDDDDDTFNTALQLQSNISFLGTVSDPGDPGNDNLDFDDWYDNATGSGTAWGFGSTGTKVLKDTTLYAKWNPRAPTPITIDAIGGVTAPVAGATPVTSITTNAQYNVAVEWSPNVTTFAPSTTYRATITVTGKANYTLTGVGANFFTVTGATVITPNVADAGVLTAEFPVTASTIATGTIAGVTVPLDGVTAAVTVTATASYTGTITWTPALVAGKFVQGQTYTAEITLTPTNANYTLFGVGANDFLVAGATSATNVANSGVITAVFPTTLKTITTGAIGGVTVPAAGAVPATTVIETDEYNGSISWAPSHDPFAVSTVYTATITLTPKSGYTLTGVAADSFTVAGTSSAATNSADSGVITAVFPSTAASVTEAVFTITFTFTDMSISASPSSSVSYSDLLDGSASITFTLGGGTFSGVTWNMDGVTANQSSDTGLTINATSNLLPYLVPGTHVLNVKGTKGSQPYAETITFSISSN